MPRPWYSKEANRRRGGWALGFFGVLLIVFFSTRLSLTAHVFGGVQRVAYHFGTSLSLFTSRLFVHEDSLSRQVEVCQNLLEQETMTVASLRDVEAERDAWRALFDYVQTSGRRGVAARIVSWLEQGEYAVVIDRGADDGVRLNDAAVVDNGALLGTVVQVSAHRAQIHLIEHASSRIPATILGTSQTLGLVSGREGSVLNMEYIPQNAQITIGDVVVTSGLGEGIPAGLVLGVVTDVVKEDSAPFISASITPVHDYRRALVVELVHPEMFQDSL